MKTFLKAMVSVFLGFFIFSGISSAQTAGKKIGYLNLSKLFDGYEKTKEYQKSLDALMSTYEKELKDRDAKIKEAEGRLAALKPEEKAKASKEIEDMKNSLTEFVNAKRTDLKKQESEKTQEILLEMEKVITEYAKKEGFDIILNDRVLLYSDPSMDTTDAVLKIMNEKYNKK